MVDLIERLERAGAAYQADGSYYFHIAAFPAYGKLSGALTRRVRSPVPAAGSTPTSYTKEDVRDFALWKAVGPDEIGWDAQSERGRPGWHIECSAMSMTLLGETLDIHCGGVDNVTFRTTGNEIAQSEAATDSGSCHLVHSQHLRVSGEKMAKRLGNFATVPSEVIEGGASPAALRYLLAAPTHFAKPLPVLGRPAGRQQSEAVTRRLVAFQERIAGLGAVDGRDRVAKA